MKVADQKATHTLLSTNKQTTMASVIDCECYSTMHKLYRVTAFVLKLIDLLRKKTTSMGSRHKTCLVLSYTGFRIVRDIWRRISVSLHGEFSSAYSWMRMNCGDVEVGYKMPTCHLPLSTPYFWTAHTT